ncbi:MAG TPA: hypothetical protein ENJ19_01155 [Gammaproteobacteria bacterium]|nr:hypothetical protein [Gammaproteobacteria bacterium]
MGNSYRKRSLPALFTCLSLGAWGLAPQVATAGATLKIDDVKSFSVGAGIRASFTAEDDAAPSGSDPSKDFAAGNMRLYTGGRVHENISLTFNTEIDSGNDSAVRVLDAIVQFNFTDAFNVWLGRFLPPSDRSNLDGPYYLNAWDFPMVQAYPAIFAGRDDGAAVWGQVGGGMFKYQAGFFEGRDGAGTSNDEDNLLFAGRVVLNFWDPEPGYYNSSTYYGSKDILAVGLTYMNQADGAGTPTAKGDFTGWNIDFLFEKKFGSAGTGTFEAAYYDYDLGDVADASLTQGSSYLILASYLLPVKTGIGQLQPLLRYQNFDRDSTNAAGKTGEATTTDVGLNYIIDGHNARVSIVYSNTDPGPGASDVNSFKIGVQLQI